MYKIKIASLCKRFFSYVVDFIAVSAISSTIIFFAMKKELFEYLRKVENGTEINIELSSKNEIKNIETKGKNVKSNVKKDNSLAINKENTQKNKYADEYEFVRSLIKKNKKLSYLVILTNFLYFLLFLLTKKQATLGQRLFSLMTVRDDEMKLTFYDCLTRVCAFYFLRITAFTMLFSKKGETLYDTISKTKVIEIK